MVYSVLCSIHSHNPL